MLLIKTLLIGIILGEVLVNVADFIEKKANK